YPQHIGFQPIGKGNSVKTASRRATQTRRPLGPECRKRALRLLGLLGRLVLAVLVTPADGVEPGEHGLLERDAELRDLRHEGLLGQLGDEGAEVSEPLLVLGA